MSKFERKKPNLATLVVVVEVLVTINLSSLGIDDFVSYFVHFSQWKTLIIYFC